ncbi:MAG: hypothetical protein WC071_07115 [Victivallaceae bacterium]
MKDSIKFKVATMLLIAGIHLPLANGMVCVNKVEPSPKDKELTQAFGINTGSRNFLLGYSCKKRADGFKPSGNSFSGLWIRAKEATGNWFWKGEGFFSLYLNNKNVLLEAPAELSLVAQGQKGIIDAKWNTKMADAAVRFVFRDNDDRIFVEVQYIPKETINTASVRLFNFAPYPYNPKNKKEKIIDVKNIDTPKRTLTPAMLAHKTPLEADENWLFYYTTSSTGFGPSALLWKASEVKSASHQPDNYTVLDFNEGVNKLHFVMWIFPSSIVWNQYLPEFKNSISEKTNKDLAEEDFQQAQKISIGGGE